MRQSIGENTAGRPVRREADWEKDSDADSDKARSKTRNRLCWQVAGADDRFEHKQRAVVEYLQFREAPAELKRKVPRRATLRRRRRSSSGRYVGRGI